MQEIERKFLVKNQDFKLVAERKTYIKQAYLNSDPNRSVRIRITDTSAFLTIKGRSSQDGTSRFEWEKEINPNEAQALMQLCENYPIEKTRFLVNYGDHLFEVDEFYGENKGLIVAEIELSTPKEIFKTPDWLAQEVTGQSSYYNSSLSKTPFSKWQ